MEIYRCEPCGNIVTKAVNGQGPLSCCGSPLKKLEAGVTDAALEKHVPVVKVDGDVLTVVVGDVLHPMTAEHYIQTILVKQGNLVQYVSLTSDSEPKAQFRIDPKKPATVYEFCNLHGLWKSEYNG